MAKPEYKAPQGLQLCGLVLLAVSVVVGVGFMEPAGTIVALLGVALRWCTQLLAWWKSRSK